MPDPNRPPSDDDEFFVGYFATPPGLTRFSLGFALAMALSALAVAAAASVFMRPPGVIESSSVELEGRLVAEPYGMLRYVDDEGAVRHALLVRGGKRGAPERVTEHDGEGARVAGLLLERDGQQLIELHRGVESAELEPDVAERLAGLARSDGGEVELDGEIVDAKCYLGRMRPGAGRTHRACAQLCVAGGIPPLFVTRDASGEPTQYVLASGDGHSLTRETLPYLAEPVTVRGRAERVGDLRILRVDASDIRRR